MARQTVEAMAEVQALQQRQDEWSRLLEEQVTERTRALQRMLDALQRLDERRDTTLRVVSHDLKNPLTVVKLQLSLLMEADLDPEERSSLVADATDALEKVERLVHDLSKLAQSGSQAALVELVPTTVDMGKLVDRMRRSLRAMVWGQQIRTSVFCTPEAPTTFETDNVLFDRVVDNLLANAAKCTSQGSILVELAGSPGMVTVKVSDTGPGIADERIEKVFRVGESSFTESGRGWGLGLPIVVRLLDQIGGRLEVMSLPGKGTTFWAHFPTSLPTRGAPVSEPPMEEAIDRVVTIRRAR
jgi:signal transduction histidine kinase